MAEHPEAQDELISFEELKRRLSGVSEQRIRAALLALGYQAIRPPENLRTTRYKAAWVGDVRRWLQEHIG